MLNALALTFALSTASADTLGRDIDGQIVDTTSKVALVFWSMDCVDCGERMAALEAAGIPMISINTDAASHTASLRPFTRRHGLTSPMLSDADGDLQRRFQITDGVVILNGQGAPMWRQDDASPAITSMLDGGATSWIAAQ